jgi:formylglycine-generating enzyme required for sulfatase activity
MKTVLMAFQVLIIFVGSTAYLFTPVVSHTEAQADKRTRKPQSRKLVRDLPISSKRWALIIGVDEYPRSLLLPRLWSAGKDAENLKNALITYAGFQEDRVILMTTSQKEDQQPTRTNIIEQLSKMIRSVEKDGLLLISFAGHGIERKRQTFLIPSDVIYNDDVSFLEQTSVELTFVENSIRNASVQQVVILLDTCRDYPTARGITDDRAYERAFSLDKRNSKVEAFALLYATSEGDRAFESSVKQGGYFTSAVVEALSGKAANEKGEVTLNSLVRYVGEKVPEMSKKGVGVEQKPKYKIEGYMANELVIAMVPHRLKPPAEAPTLTLEASKPALPQPHPPVTLPAMRVEKPLIIGQVAPSIPPPPNMLFKKPEMPPPPPRDMPVTSGMTRTNRIGSLSLVSFDIVEELDVRGAIKRWGKGQTWGFSIDLGNEINLEMVEIRGGKFEMGSQQGESGSTANERPQREVSISDFAMSKYEVTQAQWRAVAGLRKVQIDLNPQPSYFKGDSLPVEQVSWEEAVEFCGRLSRETKQNYRLPSEAEWEYACRAGTSTPFHFGKTITAEIVNYDANFPYPSAPKGKYRQQTTAVGSLRAANAFGLFDMHGNVMEWCADVWHENYVGAPKDQKSWEEGGDLKYRVVRGGNWFNKATVSRTAYRDRFLRDQRAYTIGFRIAVSK